MVFPALVDPPGSLGDGTGKGEEEGENRQGLKEARMPRRSTMRTPPRSTSHPRGSSSSPPSGRQQGDDHTSPPRFLHGTNTNTHTAPTADVFATGTTYPSPDSSTFSIHSSFISVSSLSRGSSPFESWSAGSGDSDVEVEGSRSRSRNQSPGPNSNSNPNPRARQARTNEEEVSLVLPDISIPGSVLRPSRRGTRETITPGPGRTLLPSFSSALRRRTNGTGTGMGKDREGPLDIGLTGRGGSTRAFIRALLGGSEGLRCCWGRWMGGGGGGVDLAETVGRIDGGEGGVILVFQVTEADGDEEEEEREEGRERLVARLTVFDDVEDASADTLEQVCPKLPWSATSS